MYDVCVTTGPEAHPPQPANTVAVSPGPLLIENTGRVSTVTMSVWVHEQLQSAKHTYNEPERDVT